MAPDATETDERRGGPEMNRTGTYGNVSPTRVGVGAS